MIKTESAIPIIAVSYYSLKKGIADVYMRKNMDTKLDDEGNTIYTADEIYFQVLQNVTKEYIEANFDEFWEEETGVELTEIEKLEQILADLTEIMLGV